MMLRIGQAVLYLSILVFGSIFVVLVPFQPLQAFLILVVVIPQFRAYLAISRELRERRYAARPGQDPVKTEIIAPRPSWSVVDRPGGQ